MQQLPEEIQLIFFKVFSDEITIEEFEKWLYSNKELEDILGESLYLDLVTINYKEPHGRYEMQKMISGLLDWGKYEERKLRQTLNSILNKDDEFITELCNAYNLYCGGYYFMQSIGMIGLTFWNMIYDGEWIQMTEKQKAKKVDKVYPLIKQEALTILGWLDNNSLSIQPREDDGNMIRYQYQDNRLSEELTREAIKKVEADISRSSLISKLRRFFNQ